MSIEVRVLLNDRFAPVAKLIPDQEVEIFDPFMKKHFEEGGITVDKAFVTEHRIDRKIWKVYPKDGKVVFAKAFEQFYSHYGLPQGYQWKDGEAGLVRLKLSEECKGLSGMELAKKIVEIHKIYGNNPL
ncbi:MAG: hypothetical protein ACHQUC_08095 [Chlamydiales bacterium]